MSNTFFDDPTEKPAKTATSSETENGQNQPITEPETETKSDAGTKSAPDFMSMWDQPTEHKEPKAGTNEDGEEIEDDEDGDEGAAMDPEAAAFAAELATNANQEGMSRLLWWMHGEGNPADYRTQNEGILLKAWRRFFEMLNIQITKERGIIFANLIAFGWSLGIGVWKLIARIVSGNFRWPWSKKKKEGPTADEMAAEFHGQQNQPDPIQDAEIIEPEPEVDYWADKPHSVCMWTNEKFETGQGFPKDKSHQYYDCFANRSAFQSWREHDKKQKAALQDHKQKPVSLVAVKDADSIKETV